MARRLVMIGRKRAEFHTQTVRIDNNGPVDGLPDWAPQSAPETPEPDYDLIRKQQIEGEDRV